MDWSVHAPNSAVMLPGNSFYFFPETASPMLKFTRGHGAQILGLDITGAAMGNNFEVSARFR